MDLPPPVAESNFTLHQSATIKAAISVGESSMRRAAAEVRELNAQHEPPLTTAVTYDGTWMRRGFTSLFGVFPCIHWGTGRVLDMAVFSKYCHACAAWKARMELGTIITDEFQTWQASHDGQCSANTSCSAPAMEAEAAVLLWNRSRELNGLEYQTFIGDGDGKSFRAVQESKPYGDTAVEKSECIGHVQKTSWRSAKETEEQYEGQKAG